MTRRVNAPGDRETSDGGPVSHTLAQGRDWCVSEYICTAGPADRPFEERHEWVTIAAVVEGSFIYRADGGRAVMHPGSFLFGNPGVCYECGHDHSTGDRCIALQFAPAYFAEVAAGAAGSSRFRFPTVMLPAIPRMLPWLARLEAWTAPGTGTADHPAIDDAVPRLMETVIGIVSGDPPTVVRPSARDERRISNVLRHIEAHAEDALDLDALAGRAIMSKYHFLRVFRRMVGMTPYQFVLGVRMRRAAVRLAASRDAVSAIAFDAGFGDLSTFNGRFRSVFGASPTAWRSGLRRG
jgi:AraC family transcriptional regulator